VKGFRHGGVLPADAFGGINAKKFAGENSASEERGKRAFGQHELGRGRIRIILALEDFQFNLTPNFRRRGHFLSQDREMRQAGEKWRGGQASDYRLSGMMRCRPCNC
jgi:hypothetical protein